MTDPGVLAVGGFFALVIGLLLVAVVGARGGGADRGDR